MTRRIVLGLACFALVTTVLAEIRYTVKPMPEQNRLLLSIRFGAKPGPVELQMPNWAPGAYILNVPGRQVGEFRAMNSRGVFLPFEKVGDNTWRVSAEGETSVEYTVPCSFSVGAMHYTGPSTYLYVVGRKEEGCRLQVQLPDKWKMAVGLEPGRGANTFVAPNYDVLADNPVSLGDLVLATYVVRGKPHTLAMRGVAKERADKDAFIKMCRHISESQADFFGGLPYKRYVWHLNLTNGGGGGGLEHLTSTSISSGINLTPGIVGLYAHEYFHLWNVKRIRSKPLGPFDYTQLPKTGALYWLEGTTDYYASLLPFRYGWTKESDFFDEILSNTQTVRANPARLEVSPYESSLRVGEANNGRGNSNGWRISYYNLGWLVGLLLDIEIRSLTDSKRSLDDVIRALWQLCRDDKPGFEEDEIRKQSIRFGGPKMAEFFDLVVMKPGEMPIEEQLAKMGLKMSQEQEAYTDPGFEVAPVFQSQSVRISRVRGIEGLQVDDVVLEIGGTEIKGSGFGELMAAANRAIAELKVGTTSSLKLRRAGEEKLVSFTPKSASRSRWRIAPDPNADEAKKRLRDNWYYAGKKKPG